MKFLVLGMAGIVFAGIGMVHKPQPSNVAMSLQCLLSRFYPSDRGLTVGVFCDGRCVHWRLSQVCLFFVGVLLFSNMSESKARCVLKETLKRFPIGRPGHQHHSLISHSASLYHDTQQTSPCPLIMMTLSDGLTFPP